MAQSAIEGKNVLLEALREITAGGGTLIDYVPFACATNVEFYYDTELIEKATVGMAGFKGFRPGMGEWGIRLNTVTHIIPPTSSVMYTVFDTLLESLRKKGLDIRLSYEDNFGNLQEITGHVLIPHTGINSPIDVFSEDEVELKGDGAFALNTTVSNPNTTPSEVNKIEYIATGGELTLTYSSLINRTLLYVGRSGIGVDDIGSGTPTALEVLYTSSTGTLTFGAALNPGEWILILYK